MQGVAIVGTGQTRHGKRQDLSFPELVREAVVAALEDAKLNIDDISAVVTGSMPPFMEGTNAPHLWWADGLGAVDKPLMRVATCGTTGMSIAQAAYYHVASGMYDIVLAVGAEKQYEGEPQGAMTAVFDPFYQRSFIAGAPGVFALQCNDYIHRYNIPEEEIRMAAARVSVRNHTNALDNPYAHIKIKITVEDVLKSRIIAYPVRLLDVCPASDGACAVIFAAEHVAAKITSQPAWIKGVGYAGEEHNCGDSDKVVWQSAIIASRNAYRMAGIRNPVDDLDVVELYNPFTFQELLYYELFGFCEPGQAWRLVQDGTVMPGGSLPCSPSGGVLSTNPIGATGLIRVAESAMQVTGKAGVHQVAGARTAFASAMGGSNQINGVMIISSDK